MLVGSASAQNSPASVALDASLRAAVERRDVPGVVALVTDRERVIYQSAFGVADVSTGRPLSADALFRIASMTKAVTSVALMQLIEQGRLGLDDPAEKYLPELAGLKVFESFDAATGAYQLRPAARPATVKQFLTHTSGLAYPFTSATWRDFKPRAGETYPFGGPLLFDPGERWHYSTSTDVVGRLVEVVSGQKLEGYFRQHGWGGINNTFFWIDPARGIAGVIMMQYLPFADAKALAVYDAFERGSYQLVNAKQ
jgi:CubicO group peptidase (beta-lactamase class C family)